MSASLVPEVLTPGLSLHRPGVHPDKLGNVAGILASTVPRRRELHFSESFFTERLGLAPSFSLRQIGCRALYDTWLNQDCASSLGNKGSVEPACTAGYEVVWTRYSLSLPRS